MSLGKPTLEFILEKREKLSGVRREKPSWQGKAHTMMWGMKAIQHGWAAEGVVGGWGAMGPDHNRNYL